MIVMCINTGRISVDCVAIRHDATRGTAGEHASLISHSVMRMSADFVRNREEHITNGVWYIPGSDDEDPLACAGYSFDCTAFTVSAFRALRDHTVSAWVRDWC